ncbi:MAG: hypothetical protein P8X74_14870 [Reinekea sp.]|jgi:type III secretion protein Y
MSSQPQQQQNLDWLLSMAYIYLQQNHYEKALILLQVAEKITRQDNSTDSPVIRCLVFAYLKTTRYKEALVLCDRNLKKQGINQKTAPFLLLRSHALWALERQDDARKSLDRYHQLVGSKS